MSPASFRAPKLWVAPPSISSRRNCNATNSAASPFHKRSCSKANGRRASLCRGAPALLLNGLPGLLPRLEAFVERFNQLPRLRDDLVHDLTRDIGEAEIAAVVAGGERLAGRA